MRILHSTHDYLPEQVAGVEVYTSRLMAAQRGNDAVGLITAHRMSDRRTGEFVESEQDGVPVFAVVQNRDWSGFEQSWRDARLEATYHDVLARFDPDLLHVQHLMNLTLTLVDVANERKVPIVMTLHDHWWACANGGQRFHPDRTRCDALIAAKCGTCTWSQVGPALALKRALGGRATRNGTEIAADARQSPSWIDRGRSVMRTALSRHCPTPFGAIRIESRWRAMRGLSSRVEQFLAPSQDLADAAIEFGFPAERVEVVRHGMPIPERRAPRTLPEYATHFGYVGSVVPHKGVHRLIDAFASAPAQARLSIFGSLDDDPAYVRELRERARHPGIRFEGPLEPDAVTGHLLRIDCLVAPSVWRENAPLSIQEALVARTPVIATDLGGHRELLASGGGLLVAPDDVDALRAAIFRLMNESGLAGRLSQAAPAMPGIADHVEHLRRIYRAIADR